MLFLQQKTKRGEKCTLLHKILLVFWGNITILSHIGNDSVFAETFAFQKNIMLNQKLLYLSSRSTREKLLAYLSDQAKIAKSESFTIPFSRQELADFLCVERSAMSCEISKLTKECIIATKKESFILYGRSQK